MLSGKVAKKSKPGNPRVIRKTWQALNTKYACCTARAAELKSSPQSDLLVFFFFCHGGAKTQVEEGQCFVLQGNLTLNPQNTVRGTTQPRCAQLPVPLCFSAEHESIFLIGIITVSKSISKMFVHESAGKCCRAGLNREDLHLTCLMRNRFLVYCLPSSNAQCQHLLLPLWRLFTGHHNHHWMPGI